MIAACNVALIDLDLAMANPASDKKSVEPVKFTILMRMAQMSKEPEDALKFANQAYEMAPDT